MSTQNLGAGISRRDFGAMPDGRIVEEYTLDNGRGLRLSAITHGGIVTALWLPDGVVEGSGKSVNVVLGFDNLTDYLERNPHFGVIVGRYGNRIAKGRFTLDGSEHQLDLNDGPNCLHGGATGFGTRLWTAEMEPAVEVGTCPVLVLRYTSVDGEGGFPGEMQVTVRYSLGAEQTWAIDYEARCDKPTLVNLTHHDYFNLAGRGSAMGQKLMLAASRYTEVDPLRIPTGNASVDGTPFDFRQPTVIESRLREQHAQLVAARGYDHNWLLDHPFDGELHLAATLEDPLSGRKMEIRTTEPALQFYSGNFLDGSLVGSGGQAYRQGDGLCLETQHSPDSPNQAAGDPDWPSTVLRPGEVYRSRTEHRFIA